MAPKTGWLVGLALLCLAAGCAHRGAPVAYPDIDHESAPARLAIVEVLASDYLPAFPECRMPEVLCMDPPPTWIRLRVQQTLNGDTLPRRIYASTTSHYGRITDHDGARGRRLMLLLGEGEALVMARYAHAPLHTDSRGGDHLVLGDAGPHWLPCEARALREPITDPVLARAAAIPLEQFDLTHAEEDAAYFRFAGGQAHPRYSLPIDRLKTLLAGRARPAAAYRCPPTGD